MRLNTLGLLLTVSFGLTAVSPALARTVRSTTTTNTNTNTTTNYSDSRYSSAPNTRYPASSSAPSTAAVDLSASPAANSRVGTTEARKVPLNWDAFVDVQAKIPSLDETADRGVTLNDGALYLAKDFAAASAFVELPFYYGGSNSPNFAFATGRAQAFVQKNYNGFGFKLGQYETFFGAEANDSINRFFADHGLAKGLGMIPMTHTGAQVVYGFGAVTLRGQIVDPVSFGGMQNVLPEYGIQARFDGANGGFGALGIEYGTVHDTSDQNLLIQAVGGVATGRMNFGGEVDMQQVAGSSKQGLGLEALGTFQYTELLGLGARIDYYNNMAYSNNPFSSVYFRSSGRLDNGFEIAVGPSYKLDNDLTLRSDVSFLSLKDATSDTRSDFWLSLSLVARL